MSLHAEDGGTKHGGDRATHGLEALQDRCHMNISSLLQVALDPLALETMRGKPRAILTMAHRVVVEMFVCLKGTQSGSALVGRHRIKRSGGQRFFLATREQTLQTRARGGPEAWAKQRTRRSRSPIPILLMCFSVAVEHSQSILDLCDEPRERAFRVLGFQHTHRLPCVKAEYHFIQSRHRLVPRSILPTKWWKLSALNL